MPTLAERRGGSIADLPLSAITFSRKVRNSEDTTPEMEEQAINELFEKVKIDSEMDQIMNKHERVFFEFLYRDGDLPDDVVAELFNSATLHKEHPAVAYSLKQHANGKKMYEKLRPTQSFVVGMMMYQYH